MWQVVWARTTESRGPILDTGGILKVLRNRLRSDVMVRVPDIGADGGVMLWFGYHTPEHIEKRCHGMSTMVRSE